MKNGAFHSGIKQSTYETVFGQTAKVCSISSNLSSDVIKHEYTGKYRKTIDGGRIKRPPL